MTPFRCISPTFLACLALFSTFTPAFAQTPGKGPKAKVTLLPFVDGVVAGQPFQVGVQFVMEEQWHIYWKNSGDSGLPPTIQWKLPEGFTADSPQFPVPKREYSAGDIVTNVLGGEPTLLVQITPPATISGEKVSLAADVKYLVCSKDNCIQEKAAISAELPVKPAGSEVAVANQPIQRRAQRALPLTASKHLEIKPTVAPAALTPGTEFELGLQVAIKPGIHIQAHKPSLPQLIPAEVFIEKMPGVQLMPAIYPEPKLREVPALGKIAEYSGTFTIRIAGKVDSDTETLPKTIDGVFAYQACNDAGSCFPPEGLAFSAKVGGEARGEAAPGVVTPVLVTNEAIQPTEPSTPDKLLSTNVVAPSAPGNETPANANANSDSLDGFFKRFGLIGLLAACFLYGLFINATPCVLPLLSIKVLGFVQQAHESRRKTFVLGLSFGVGVILFFVLLGLLAARGKNVLMYPEAVIALGGIILALSLSMLGVYTLQVPRAATSLEARIHNEGVVASFGKGALAPVLGFACTGPLLAGVWGWAVQQEPTTAILSFIFAGLGMASPYMLLGANPGWLSFLPKPGNWMITFERIMGFLLLIMVIWMVYPLVAQIGADGLVWTMIFYVVVAFACWILGRVSITMSDLQRWRYRGAALTTVAVAAAIIYGTVYPIEKGKAIAKAERAKKYNLPAVSGAEEFAWRMWTPAAVEQTVKAGKVVFVDFTAAYCTVCKVNKAVAIETPEVKAKLGELGAVSFQGDYTDGDPDITDILHRYDRAGVPLNLIYPPNRPDSPIVLEPSLSKEYLLAKLSEAAALATASAAP